MQEQLFFEGLRALAEAAFPKHCACCGRVFVTADELRVGRDCGFFREKLTKLLITWKEM